MEALIYRRAQKREVKLKIGISGPEGSGKTKSALNLAYGITGNWETIAVLDSENGSADLYSNLGAYNVIPLIPPYSPERFIEGVELATGRGCECLIIDSFSREWDGTGGIMSLVDEMNGNNFNAWGKVTPRHTACIDSWLNAPMHVIVTLRKKTDYIIEKEEGKKTTIRKVGLKDIQREGLGYEFSLYLEMVGPGKGVVKATKDRTELFDEDETFHLNEKVGMMLKDWALDGISRLDIAKRRISTAHYAQLVKIFEDYSDLQEDPEYIEALQTRKAELKQIQAKKAS